MWMVLILLIIILVALILLILVMSSTLSIEIQNFEANNYVKEEKIIKDYMVHIHLYLGKRIRWFGLKIDQKRINKFKTGRLLKGIDKRFGVKRGEELQTIEKLLIDNKKKILSKKTLKNIKELRLNVSRLNLYLDIGSKNVIITSFIVAFISSGISILLGKNINADERKKYYYLITPLYMDKNIFKIKVNCIINVKVVHIMNMLYILLKKRSGNKYGGTSNRRAYDYSHEQHRRHGRCKYDYRGAN